jgi:hypothetical protein
MGETFERLTSLPGFGVKKNFPANAQISRIFILIVLLSTVVCKCAIVSAKKE